LTKILLIITAVLEVATGLIMMAAPSLPGESLTGLPIDTASGLIVARIAGAALLAIGAACWLARDEGHSRAGRALIAGLLVYNVGVVAVLAFAGMHSGVNGTALWPGAGLHMGLAAFCILALRRRTRIPD
jgi:hypothetical protein